MNDPGRQHAYPGRVRFEIAEADAASYRRAADFLNVNGVDVVSVQHEYGIFGGELGRPRCWRCCASCACRSSRRCTRSSPARACRSAAVMDELAEAVAAAGRDEQPGASTLARGLRRARRTASTSSRTASPPSRPGCESKQRLGVDGRMVLLTFGLLSPDKGIEYVIDALPAIVASCPDGGLHRARRDAPARQGRPRRGVSPDARSARRGSSASTST